MIWEQGLILDQLIDEVKLLLGSSQAEGQGQYHRPTPPRTHYSNINNISRKPL